MSKPKLHKEETIIIMVCMQENFDASVAAKLSQFPAPFI